MFNDLVASYSQIGQDPFFLHFFSLNLQFSASLTFAVHLLFSKETLPNVDVAAGMEHIVGSFCGLTAEPTTLTFVCQGTGEVC